MDVLTDYIRSNVLIAIFLAVGIGYALGKIKIGKFQLGGIAGSLIVAVIIGQLGFNIPGILKTAFFALFIYACGYEGGPKFFGALNNKASLKFVISAFFMTVMGLICVLIAAHYFDLDRGLAAGLAAGGLTQSAIIGTAGNSIGNLGLSQQLTKQLETNVAVGYSVTYIFGTLGPVLMVGTILPLIMKWDLRKSAIDLEKSQAKGIVLGDNQILALEKVSSRIFEITSNSKYLGKTAKDLELDFNEKIFLLDVAKDFVVQKIDNYDNYVFQEHDIVVIGGKTKLLLKLNHVLGSEVFDSTDLFKTTEYKKSIIFQHKKFAGKSIDEIKTLLPPGATLGFVISQVYRYDEELPLIPGFEFQVGDEIILSGRKQNIENSFKVLGYTTPNKNIVNYITFSVGMILGIIIGEITIPIDSIPISLGTGGGCLFSGLIFGWLKSKYPKVGGMDTGTVSFLKVFGLVIFVVIVGLNAGKSAIITIENYGMTLFWLGVFVTMVPQIITFIFNYFVLKIKNPVNAVAIIAGGRSANPAYAEVLRKTQNSTPVLPFSVGYAVANVFLTMWGPVIVGIITKN
ncbi:aspartate-alanine antiporter [Cetobacterium sp. SF1]|uniref:aspartate-alanine antiporter n=2 Tax=unclassified Cetobacterium TaxID=2630983 RepID=UPI003CE82DDC